MHLSERRTAFFTNDSNGKSIPVNSGKYYISSPNFPIDISKIPKGSTQSYLYFSQDAEECNLKHP